MRAATLLIALLCGGLSVAQELRFQHLTSDDGLSDNAITCIYQDRAGYIWIGTENGLNRYDGQRVERFPAGPDGPGGDHISSIAEDAHGDLWITTIDAGLSKRDHATGRYTHLQHDPADPRSVPTNALTHVLVLDDSLLLLSSQDRGAIWYHQGTGVVQCRGFNPSVVNAKGDTTVRAEDNWCHDAVRLDDRRIVLSMLRPPGLCVVDAETGGLVRTLGVTRGPITNLLLANGALYMGGWTNGLHRVDPEHPEWVAYFPMEEEITAMVQWDDRHLVAATKLSGLLRVDKDGAVTGRDRHVRSDPSSLRSDRTTCLLRDRANNLWVGTAKGVSVYAPSVWRFDAIPLLPQDHVGDMVFHSIQQDENSTIRLSTSKGFILVDPVSHGHRIVELIDAGVPLEVTGLFRTGADEWFVGTETGIFRYDPGRARILPSSETGKWSNYHAGSMFQSRAINRCSVGGRDLLILGALGYGHIAIDPATATSIPDWVDYPDQRGTMMLRSTLLDAHGMYWSATRGGVVRWMPVPIGDEPSGIVFGTQAGSEHRLPGDDAQALAWRGDTLWVALRDAGLASIVGDRAYAHPPPAHMPHDALGLTIDRAGHVGGTTSNGLLRYTPRTSTWLHVPVNNGNVFRQLTKCIATLHDGRIAFCADDHLLIFDPRTYDELPELPAPTLFDMSNTWGDLRADASGTLELPYRNSAFDVMLTALQPVGAAPLTFLYRLDSEGERTHAVTGHEPDRYAGVPSGSHRLLVRERDAYGREGPEHDLLAVTVIGPFWQRWWFFVLVLAAGAIGMYLVSRLRQKQRAKLQHVRDRIARDLHDDIGSTLGSISFYSEALKRKLENVNDGMAQEVAEKIGASSREMIDQMSDIVWSVDPKHDDAAALIARLQAFASDLLATRNIALHFSADPALKERKLTADQRRNLFLIGKEVLYNTLKYADARTVRIRFTGGHRSFTMELQDDGRGFDPGNTDSYNGNGLPNMKNRAVAIAAEFILESSPGSGTLVRVVVPPHGTLPQSWD